MASPTVYLNSTKVLTPIYSDDQIIELLEQKNQRSIPIILDKYGDKLYGIAYHRLQSELAASAILKRPFVAIWNRTTVYNKIEEPLFSWLLKIMNQTMANTICLIAQRKRFRNTLKLI